MNLTMLRFGRYTCQGVAIASLGTVGVSASWAAFVEGIIMLCAAMILLYFERKGNFQ